MGTRNLTCVILNEETKVAQYCQWDGYPSGQGLIVFEFLKSCDLENFKKQVAKVRAVTDEEIKAAWAESGCEPDDEWVGLDVANKMEEKYPEFHRNLGAKILQKIADGEVSVVNLDTEFASNSLFCEYVYVVDLDRQVLEVYEGFIKEPHIGERFSNLLGYESKSDKYYPVKLNREIPFNELPETKEEFVALFEKECGG